MIVVFDSEGRYMALAEGIDPVEYAELIGGTPVSMVGEQPTDLHEPRIDGSWHIPDETVYANSAAVEASWRTSEMAVIAEQLLMLEDGDPNALPGTVEDWRAYRIALRKWSSDNLDFPDSTKRPVAPGSAS